MSWRTYSLFQFLNVILMDELSQKSLFLLSNTKESVHHFSETSWFCRKALIDLLDCHCYGVLGTHQVHYLQLLQLAQFSLCLDLPSVG